MMTDSKVLEAVVGAIVCVGLIGCRERVDKQRVETQPAERPAKVVETAPGDGDHGPGGEAKASTPGEPAATQPAATQPVETQPAKPKSTYSHDPPYPVSLFVENPKEKQPGWLRIEALVDDDALGTAKGTFPEQNRIYVDTGNVNRVRIHVGHLPLRPKERVILQIDGQGMVISRSREFTTLERLGTGEWVVVKD